MAKPPAADPTQLELELVRFKKGSAPIDFNVDFGSDTIWATLPQIAELFGIGLATVERHLAAMKAEGEIERDTEKRSGPRGSSREVTRGGIHYDLDAILGVGYRVNSAKAAAFRKWATQTLRASIVEGFAINEARLREDGAATDTLAAKLRAIRSAEDNIYATVRGFFEAAAADFDADSESFREFMALLEEKFLFAATGETASDLIIERASHTAPDMGLQSFHGSKPTIEDAKIAANYLDTDELYVLHTLCEQFLLFVQSKALRKEPMSMRDLMGKLDALLRAEDYPVLPVHKDFHKERAVRHAQAEYARFIMRADRLPKRVG